MPNSTIENTNSQLKHFTFRELLTNKSMAVRAVKRGRSVDENTALIARIEAELERRQEAKWSRLHADLPAIPALDETSER